MGIFQALYLLIFSCAHVRSEVTNYLTLPFGKLFLIFGGVFAPITDFSKPARSLLLLEKIFHKIVIKSDEEIELQMFGEIVGDKKATSSPGGLNSGVTHDLTQICFLTVEVSKIITIGTPKKYENSSFLINLYIRKRWSLRRIFNKIGCSENTVKKVFYLLPNCFYKEQLNLAQFFSQNLKMFLTNLMLKFRAIAKESIRQKFWSLISATRPHLKKIIIFSEPNNPSKKTALQIIQTLSDLFPKRAHAIISQGEVNLVIARNSAEKFQDALIRPNGQHDSDHLFAVLFSQDGTEVEEHLLHELGGLFRI